MVRIWLLLFVMLLTLQGRLWAGDASIGEVRSLAAEVEQRRQANQRMAAENRALEAEIVDLRNGLEAMEGRARRELGMIRSDESFFLVVHP